MAKVSTNVIIDKVTKKKAQALLADFGRDLSTAVNIFLKQMVYEGYFPFSITRWMPNTITLAAMDSVEGGKDICEPFDNVEDAMDLKLNLQESLKEITNLLLKEGVILKS